MICRTQVFESNTTCLVHKVRAVVGCKNRSQLPHHMKATLHSFFTYLLTVVDYVNTFQSTCRNTGCATKIRNIIVAVDLGYSPRHSYFVEITKDDVPKGPLCSFETP